MFLNWARIWVDKPVRDAVNWLGAMGSQQPDMEAVVCVSDPDVEDHSKLGGGDWSGAPPRWS